MRAPPTVLALHTAAIACSAWLLLAVLCGAVPVELGPFDFAIAHFGPLLGALGILFVLYAAAYRGALHAWWRRMAEGALDARDARAGRLFLGALVVVGFALRIARLQEYAFSPDEGQFVYFGSADSLAEVWRYVMKRSPHPPTNFVLLHYLLKVSWNPLWLRLPSVLAGTFLIWLAHRFGRALAGPAAGMAMAVLVAFSPAAIYLSSVCRNYAPGFAFLLLAIHLLVRHLRTDRWRPLAGFAAVAPLAGIWHYGFVVAFIALDAVVAVELLARRRPWQAWLAVILAHLPFAAVMGFFYHVHISRMSDYLTGFHQVLYARSLSNPAAEIFETFHSVWQYLENFPFAEIFYGLSALGAVCLLVNGERLVFLVCVVPLVVAFAFNWAGKIPLGATRHSAYLFPFLFGLVASQVPEILNGYRRTRSNLRRRFAPAGSGLAKPEADETGSARRAPFATSVVGAAVIAIGGAVFAGASLIDHGAEKVFDPRSPGSARTELPAWYFVEDLDRGFALLENRVGENDLVVLEFQGALATRMHYRITPPARKPRSWAGWTRRVRSFSRNGVTYYYTHLATVLTPAGLLAAVERVLAARRLPEPERVWTVHGSWEVPLAQQFRGRFPGHPFDAEVERESNGRVFAIDFETLRAIAGGQRAILVE